MSTWFLALIPACIVTDVDSSAEDFVVEEPFTEVVIDLDSGDARVWGSAEANVATGSVVSAWSGDPPEVTRYVEDGVLHVTARCGALQFVCSIDVELEVPAGVGVTLETGSGNLVVDDLVGDTKVTTGSGNIDLGGLAGLVQAETGSGDVSLCDTSGDVYAETGSGDIQGTGLASPRVVASTGSGSIVLEQVVPFEGIDAETGSGDVRLTVPAGAFQLQLDSGSGDVEVDSAVCDDPAASATIRARTGSGDIMVLGR